VVGQADVVLGLEVIDFWGVTHQFREHIVSSSTPITKAGAKIISISSGDLFIKANYQNFQRFEAVDIAIAAVDDKTYGSCENCREPIPKARLRALPYARLCVSCKSGGLHRR